MRGESVTAKLKKAPGGLIGRWKQDVISANPGASDEDLPKIVNEMSRLQGYDYAKGRFTTARPFRSAWQTAVAGGLAATAAFVFAKLIG
jgi:hypothetical protein